MKKEPVPVKISVLITIYKALLPIKSRLDAILQDHYTEKLLISQAELTALLEFRSAAATAELMFDDYMEQAEEAQADLLYLPPAEFSLLLDLSKTAELATRTPLVNSGLWTH